MAIFKFDPGCNEWLDKRTKYITATEVASLFSMNPSKGPKKVLKDKIEPPIRRDNKFMRAGRLLEPSVILAMQEAGLPAEAADPSKTVFVTHDKVKLAASMDAKMNVKEGFHIVECKTTSMKKFDEWEVKVPHHYALQIQTQLLVSGVDKGLIACLSYEFPFPLVIYEVRKSERIQGLILEETNRFWDCYKKGIDYVTNKEYTKEIRGILNEYEKLLLIYR